MAEAAETGNPRGNNDGFEAGTLRYLIPVRKFNDAPFCKAGLTNGSVVQGADFSVHPVSPHLPLVLLESVFQILSHLQDTVLTEDSGEWILWLR